MSRDDFKHIWTDAVFSKPITRAKFRRGLALFVCEIYNTSVFIGMSCSSMVDTPMIPGRADHMAVTFAVILSVTTAVWTTSHISVLMNPGLTMAVVILGHMSIYRCMFLIVAQIIGATCGILVHFLMVPDLQKGYCKLRRNPAVPAWLAFLYEVLISAYLCWALCGLLDKRRIGTLRNLALKFAIVLYPLFLNATRLYVTSVNTAFALGGSIVALDFTETWIGAGAPIVGCIIWALFYRLIFDNSIEEKSEAKTLYNVVE